MPFNIVSRISSSVKLGLRYSSSISLGALVCLPIASDPWQLEQILWNAFWPFLYFSGTSSLGFGAQEYVANSVAAISIRSNLYFISID